LKDLGSREKIKWEYDNLIESKIRKIWNLIPKK